MHLLTYSHDSVLTWELNSSLDKQHEIYGAARGLCLKVCGFDVTGEGIGIGGVVAVVDNVPFFPLDVVQHVEDRSVVCRYVINGRSSKYLFNRKKIDRFYSLLHQSLAPLYLSSSLTRPFFVYLMAVRTLLHVRNRFEKVRPLGVVETRYTLDGYGSVGVEVNLDSVDVDEVFIANELSGRFFTQLYVDGVRVKRLGPWIDITGCNEAALCSPALRMSVCIPGLDNCRMFSGREVLGKRLDWTGVSYVTRPGAKISYRVVVRKHDA